MKNRKAFHPALLTRSETEWQHLSVWGPDRFCDPSMLWR